MPYPELHQKLCKSAFGNHIICHPCHLTTRQSRFSSFRFRSSIRPPSSSRNNSSSTKSTVEVGTSYEYLCATTLECLGFSLSRTGGRSDKGIDLLGTWNLPSKSHSKDEQTLHVVVQCKARKDTPNPMWIRELDGAVAGAPFKWRGDDVIRTLCAKGEATVGVREAVRNSRRPLIWVRIEDLGERTDANGELDLARGRVRQLLWNHQVQCMVGQGLGVGVKYVHGKKGPMEQEVCLTLEGKIWQPVSRG